MTRKSKEYLSELTKQEQRELIQAIDGVLDMFFIPIRKIDDGIATVERAIGDLMIKSWDQATRNAVKQAAATINQGTGPVTQEDVQMVVETLAEELGPGLEALTPKQVTELVGASYTLGKKGVMTEIGARATLKLEDVRSQNILKKHHTFWIGDYYNSQLGKEVADIARDIGLKQGLGRVEVGKRLQAALGQQFDKSESYWRLLGAASVHRARNLGGVQGLIDGGVKEYEIMAVMDERTSDICRAMDGRVFTVGDASKLKSAIMNASHPDDIKDISPWHTARATPGGYEIKASGSQQWVNINNLNHSQMVNRGLALPPYHGFCRTTYIVRTFQDVGASSVEPFPMQFEQVQEQPSGIPPAMQLKLMGDAKHLGGAGEKYIYSDKKGDKFLFKPAVSKAGNTEEFRAYVQEAASEIQKLAYDHSDFIEVKTITLNGRKGTIQKVQPDVTMDLKGIQDTLHTAMSQGHRERIQQEHVIDWLISNHDAHGGQFILTKSNKVFAIDKEQAFRYFPNDKLDWTYHPNKSYGEKEPIYNTLMRKWASKEVDLNPNSILPMIQRIESIPDAQYTKILEPYAKSLFAGNQTKQKQFIQQAIARKNSIRKDFEHLYSKVLTERLGKKYTFKFADKMTAKEFAQAPLSVQSFSKADLSKMTAKSLKDLAKKKEVLYFQQMTKAEVIEALAYPDKAEAISAAVKQRVAAKAAAKRSEGEITKPRTPPRRATSTDPFEDLDSIGAKEYGYALQKDSVIVEGQHVNVRKVFNGERDEYQISFKVTAPYLDDLDSLLKNKGAKVNFSTVMDGGTYDRTGKFLANRNTNVQVSSRNLQGEINGAKVMFFNDYNARAYRGRMYITVDAYDGKKGADQLLDVLKELNLEAIKSDPTEADERLLKLSRLLIQHNPKKAASLSSKERTVEGLEKILKAEGINPNQVDKWSRKEVWPGYFTHLDEAGAEMMKKAGADHLFAGVPQVDGMVGILSGDGLMSTTERYRNGIFRNGASSSEDIRTGGAEQVFTRLVTKQQVKEKQHYSNSFAGGPYVIKIKPDVLARTDWYAFDHDNYGRSEDYSNRKGRTEIVESLKAAWRPGNEVMFRHGITLDHFEEVRAKTEQHRQELIEKLKAAGKTKINGKPLEDFIVTEATMG